MNNKSLDQLHNLLIKISMSSDAWNNPLQYELDIEESLLRCLEELLFLDFECLLRVELRSVHLWILHLSLSEANIFPSHFEAVVV